MDMLDNTCLCEECEWDNFLECTTEYCDDDIFDEDFLSQKLTRRTGRAYRRLKKRQKRAKRLRIISYGYNPSVGYIKYGFVDGEYRKTGTHIQYPKNSNAQAYWKNQANKRLRRYKGEVHRGNSYRKYSEYIYMIY